MASSIVYPVVVDDKDLDDAALWAVIDSATASHSSTNCKSLAIKYTNCPPSPSPISKPSPPTKFQRISRDTYSVSTESRVSGDGEVVHEPWSYRPPRKVARTCPSEASESSPLAVVRNVQRTPPTPVYSSPEAHLSPQIGRFKVHELIPYADVSPGHCSRNEEKENMTHGFSGRFPSVSLFKEYQNAAMAVTVPIYFSICSILSWTISLY